EDLGHFKGPLEVVEARLTQPGVGTDRVGPWVHTRHRRAGQPVVVQFLAEFAVVSGVPRKQRDLDAIEARLLQLAEQREVLLGDMRRPQQQVHSGLHGCNSSLTDYLCKGMTVFFCRGRSLFFFPIYGWFTFHEREVLCDSRSVLTSTEPRGEATAIRRASPSPLRHIDPLLILCRLQHRVEDQLRAICVAEV